MNPEQSAPGTNLTMDFADRAARDSRYRALFEHATDGIIIVDAQGNYIDANPSICRLLGYSRAELIGMHGSDIVSASEVQHIEPSRQATRTTTSFQREWQFKRKDGSTFEAEVISTRLPDGSLFGIIRDLSQRRQMEANLRASQARLQSAVAAGAIGTWTWDLAHDRLTADEFTARMFSLAPEAAAQGLPASEYLKSILEADQPIVSAALAHAIQSCSPYDLEYRVRQKDGTITWLQARGRVDCDQTGRAALFHGAIMDISERRQAAENIHRLNAELEERVAQRTAQLEAANEQLRHSRAELNSLFESLPGLYLVLDLDLNIVAVSDAYLSATMTQRAEILGRKLFDVFPDNPDDAANAGVANLRASLARVVQKGAPDTMAIQKYDIRRPDGSFEERYWSPINSPVFGLDRQIKYLVHRVEEVTDFVQQKRQLAGESAAKASQLQQMEAEVFKSSQRLQATNQELQAAYAEMEAFSYSVSHDLRAPLRAINGFADIVANKFGADMPPGALPYLEKISHGGRQMGLLIDDLLAFSRLSRQAMNRKTIATAELVPRVLQELAPLCEGRRLEIAVGALPDCLGDHALLKQVWINLLSNAIKYTRGRDPARIEIGSLTDGGETIFYVRDNGAGFDMKYAGKLFGVFQRLHTQEEFEGTGVGLAIVKRIVNRHAGRIWAEAELDRGATFKFTLGSA